MKRKWTPALRRAVDDDVFTGLPSAVLKGIVQCMLVYMYDSFLKIEMTLQWESEKSIECFSRMVIYQEIGVKKLSL